MFDGLGKVLVLVTIVGLTTLSDAQPRRIVPHMQPQTMPAPYADPSQPYPQQQASPGGGGVPALQQPVYSNACYIAFQPMPVGCWLNGAAPITSSCGCFDAMGNLIPGVVWR
jgi:hypothetical protein